MILEIKTNNEFHPNGNIAYEETVAIIAPISAHLYRNRTIHPDGYCWIRIGRNAKYFDNGQLAWVLNYDDQGNVIKENNRHYRKDGYQIIFHH